MWIILFMLISFPELKIFILFILSNTSSLLALLTNPGVIGKVLEILLISGPKTLS